MMLMTRRAFSLTSVVCAVPLGRKAVAAGGKTLRMRTVNRLPRMSRLGNGIWTGYEIEMARALCEGAGFTLEEVPVPNWTRSIKMMQEGDLDLLTTVSYREERTAFLDYVGPFDIEELVVLVRAENGDATFGSLDAFMVPGRVFQVVAGAAIEPEFDRRMKEDPEFARHFITATAASRPDRWDMMRSTVLRVQRKRIFGAITDWYNYNDIKYDPDRVKYLGSDPVDIVGVTATFAGKPPTYLAASLHVDAATREALHESYERLRSSGEFEKI